jgi:hypothetical protein
MHLYLKSIIIILFAFLKLTYSNISTPVDTSRYQLYHVLKISAGIGILGFECIGIPLLDVKNNYGEFPRLRNPFRYIKEKEPYLEDELWHFVGASSFTDINFRIFRDLFFLEDPYLISGLFTIGFWTGMECLDALSGSGFSLRDECGNILGTMFSLYTIRHPDFPLRVRIGIKDVSSFKMALKNVISGSIHHQLGKQYDFMDVEFIYMIPHQPVYTGIAISRGRDKIDLYGVTAGFDIPTYANYLTKKKWSEPIEFISRHFSVSVNLTVWLN